MDKPNALPESTQLLDDLESIRRLLGDDSLEPPLLTDAVDHDEAIPTLSDAVDATPEPVETATHDAPLAFELEADTSPFDEAYSEAQAPVVAALAPAAASPEQNRQDTLLHLDVELRAAAQMIMQDVIDDFAPHIETEIKRRLEARLERLLGQH